MKSTDVKFDDGYVEKVKFLNQFLIDSFYERSQLYGTLAKLMLSTHTDSFTINKDELEEAESKYSVHFTPVTEDGEVTSLEVEIMEHKVEEKESDS